MFDSDDRWSKMHLKTQSRVGPGVEGRLSDNILGSANPYGLTYTDPHSRIRPTQTLTQEYV